MCQEHIEVILPSLLVRGWMKLEEAGELSNQSQEVCPTRCRLAPAQASPLEASV